jgi:hypothetical protein
MAMINNQIYALGNQLELAYTKDELSRRFTPVLKSFFEKNRGFLIREGVDADLIDAKPSSITKIVLANQCAIPFASLNIYTRWLDGLSEPVRKAVWLLIWEDGMLSENLSILINTPVENGFSNSKSYDEPIFILPEFKFLTSHNPVGNSYYHYRNRKPIMSLPLPIRKILSTYYEQPEYTKIIGTEKTPELGQDFHDCEQTILQEWPRVLAYVNNGQLDFTINGRPKLTGLNRMQKQLSLREFIPTPENKKLKYLRTYLLGAMARLAPAINTSETVPQQIKQLFDIPYKKGFSTPLIMLLELKGSANIQMRDVIQKEHLMLELLTSLPAGEWVDFDRIIGHIKYNFWNIRPIEFNIINNLYFNHSSYGEPVEHHQIREAIEYPCLRGTFFLYAAFGLCEINFNEPFSMEHGDTYFSPWDDILAVRRTKLGDYVCGLSDEYDSQHARPAHTFVLSPETLMITMAQGNDAVAKLMEPYAERIAASRFKTDAALFLKGVSSKKQLESKIELFKQQIAGEIPPNWQTFLHGLLLKINPFQTVSKVKVLQLPADNKALIQLVIRDPVLAPLVNKAEGHMLIIQEQDMNAFKRRLQEFGYLITT